MISRLTIKDATDICGIINDAAVMYSGKVPDSCYRQPYMRAGDIAAAVSSGVDFWGGYSRDNVLVSVMGLQRVKDVCLVRHAYTARKYQRQGISGKVLEFLRERVDMPLLVGTWAGTPWSVNFYAKHGFLVLPEDVSYRLLVSYWSLPEDHMRASLVLLDERWAGYIDKIGGGNAS